MEFVTRGPYIFKPIGWPRQRIYTREVAITFCEQHAELLEEVGCYIFLFRASRGYKPWYIGKTDNSFRSETFANDKLQKYNEAVASGQSGTGQLIFLVAPGRVGNSRSRRIAELELYLIQEAANKNPDLINVRGTSGPDWGIRGVLRSSRGTSNRASQELKRVMSW